MAHKKGVGSTDNGRDSKSKRLGVKLFGGQVAIAGNVLVRQRGTKFHPGDNVYMGKDFTLHAKVDGKVEYKRKRNNRTFVNILPMDAVPETVAKVAAKPKAVKEEKPVVEVKEEPTAPIVEEPAQSVETEASAPAEPQSRGLVDIPAPEEVKTEPKPKATKSQKITLPSGKKIKQDDLKMVEGVGPKIEGLLNEAGIQTWSELANADIEKLKEILANAGSRYRMHDPTTWAKQAELADAAKWEELEAYQDRLKGGKEVD